MVMHEEELRRFCRPKQLEVEMYWTKLREVYNSYLEEHNPIMNHYQSLKEKDEFYQKEIAKNDMQIQLATENLLNLQQEWQRTTTTSTDKLKRMSKRKEELSRQCMQIKKDSKAERSKHNHQLTVMVNASQDAVQRLEAANETLNKALQMAEICSKYEHEGDDLVKDVDNEIESVDFENLDGDMINECKQYNKMNKFLMKVNRARVQTMCLKTEKSKLVKENDQLKHYIKRYLTELALKGKDRPLSMKIRSEVQKIDSKILRPVTCIEGALSNAVQHEKRLKDLEKRQKHLEIRAYPRVQCWT
ncbi:unnamed protein product [Arctia plantaginis]|uniref:Uncharacterized protein n=1 Tax=Arctia plantaginis TaxID=874455 RepID=A0A8S0Z470_ARCPL|nr:unnamed protein product [Arctia plantaginis]